MSTEVRWRRGTAAQNNAFTGALAEVTVDTTNGDLRVHDGSSAGGVEGKGLLARAKDYADNLPAASAASTAALAAMPVSLGFVQMRALGREGPFRVSLVSELTASEVAARALDTTSAIFVSSTADTDYVWVRVHDKVLANWFGVLPWNADNSDALDAFHAYVAPQGLNGEYLAGDYKFGRALTRIFGNDWQIFGAGRHSTTFIFDGPTNVSRLFQIGEPDDLTNNFAQGFRYGKVRWISQSDLSDNIALYIKRARYFELFDLGFGDELPYGGEGLLRNGLWLDESEWCLYIGFSSRLRGNHITVHGSTALPVAGFYIDQGKIWTGGIGIHVAGGFGGIYTGYIDAFGGQVGILVDQTYAAVGNAQVFVSSHTIFDNYSQAGIRLNDAGDTNKALIMEGWVASCALYGIHVIKWGTASYASITIAGSTQLISNADAGILVQDAWPVINIDAAANITSNKYGIFSTTPTTKIFCAARIANNTTSNFGGSTGIEERGNAAVGGQVRGYKRYADGRIHQWGTVAGNDTVDTSVTFLVPFTTIDSLSAELTGSSPAATVLDNVSVGGRTTAGFTGYVRFVSGGTVARSSTGWAWEAWGV